ncbi:MAG TPA: glycosyltransferase [Thermoanaerobaculia bacterium]|nr:glycosyltransferase [Thermoanaerobaculia bacterium]
MLRYDPASPRLRKLPAPAQTAAGIAFAPLVLIAGMAPESPPLPPLIIAGMHRSGTSLVGAFLNAAGVALGERLLPGNATNPDGYFEDAEIVDLHRRMLCAAVPGDDGGHPDWGWSESERLDRGRFVDFAGEAAALIAARAGPRPWGWKDPRTTLALDFWDGLAGGARYLLLYRFPWEVADSMQRLGAAVFLDHPGYAHRIWRFYNRHLLDFHRRHRDRSMLLSADVLLRDPDQLATLLRERAHLSLPGLAPSFAQLIRGDRFVAQHRDDPIVRLVATTTPASIEVLRELDHQADLPGAELWEPLPEAPRPRRSLPAAAAEPAAEQAPLSIVIPCCDHGEFLIEALASVERAVAPPYELIIVNDGSREARTLEVLAALRRAGYTVLDQENQGLFAARNRGIAAAHGRYILPLDADNRLRPGFAAAALAVLDHSPAVGVVYGGRYEFGLRTGEAAVPQFDLDLLLTGNYIDACAVFRKQVWSECGGYSAGLLGWEDWELWIAAAERGWDFHRLSAITFDYRVRPNSLLTPLRREETGRVIQERIVQKHRELYLQRLPEVLIRVQRQARSAAELARTLQDLTLERDRLAQENHSLMNLRDRLADERDRLADERNRVYGELERWRSRVAVMEGTRAWRLRLLLQRVRHWLQPPHRP